MTIYLKWRINRGMFNFEVVPSAHYEKLKKVALTKMQILLLERITTYNEIHKKYLVLACFCQYILVTLTMLIYAFSEKLITLGKFYLVIPLFITFILATFVEVFVLRKSHRYLNLYIRNLRENYGHLIALIIEDYRLSLADKASNFPDARKVGHTMSEGVICLANYASTISIYCGAFTSILITFIVGVVLHSSNHILISLAGLTVLLLFGLLVFYARKYTESANKYHNLSDKVDAEFRESQPLILDTIANIMDPNIDEVINKQVTLTQRINTVTDMNTFIFPVLLMLAPLLLTSNFSFLVIVTYGFYVSSRIFSRTRFVSERIQILSARRYLSQCDDLLTTVLERGYEMTEARYQEIRIPADAIVADCDDGLEVKNLTFIAGRSGGEYTVALDYAKFPRGKISFLIGSSGVGKSIFGRLLTLRFLNFKADFVGFGSRDIRSFESLQEGKSGLHFSGLRNIYTSYRNAMSVYIRSYRDQTTFITASEANFSNISAIVSHIEKYSDNYLLPLGVTTDIFTNDLFLTVNRNDAFYYDVAETFKLLTKPKELEVAFNKLMLEENKNYALAVLLFAFLCEFEAYTHMRKYISDATLYFMDAILSEPPISQGQRRRILYALDAYVKGNLLVIDEPFANLDVETASNIFIDLAKYASINNSVVIILDQKIIPEVMQSVDKSLIASVYGFDDYGSTKRIFKLQ